MSIRSLIIKKLENSLEIQLLSVLDESHLHHGHAGARPEGETHFRIILRSSSLKGLSRVEISRKIHLILQDELQHPIHALSIDARAEL